MTSPRCALLLAVGLFSTAFSEQPDIIFERVSVEEGLSQSIVVSIIQDRRGFLWFGTEDGLNLYDGYSFRVLRNDPADSLTLSYNHITCISEDRSGDIWVGTFNGGLNRYILKQNRFYRYRSLPTDKTTLSSDIINCVAQDRHGTLWIGTDRGLDRLVPGTPTGGSPAFKRHLHDPRNPESISGNFVTAMCLDSAGVLWIGTTDGLNSMAPGDKGTDMPRFKRYRHNRQDPRSISHDTVRALSVDRSGVIWVGTENGLDRIERGAGDGITFTHFKNVRENPHTLSNNEVYAILEDDAGTLWVGTDGGGLNRLDRSTGRFAHFLHDPRNPGSLSYNEIRSLFQDRSGILWVGTYGGGVNKVNARKKQFAHYRSDPNNPNTLNENIVWSIYEDRQGLLWIGTHGGGLNRFDRENNRFAYYRNDPRNALSLSHDIVRVVIGDPSGDLWVGTNGGGICRFHPATGTFTRYLHDPRDSTSLSHNEIRSLYLDGHGVLWVGTNGGGLNSFETHAGGNRARFTRYRQDPGKPGSISSDFVRVIHEDRSGILWIGTQGGGLNRFDRTTGTFEHFRADPARPDALNNDFVFCIHEDTAGIFWLGTWGGGLNRFDPASRTFSHFTTRDGLPSDAIYGILEDDRGFLWFSSNNGLTRFSPGNNHIKNYSVSDGLQNKEFNGGSYHRSVKGEMFFGGISGFNAFVPERIQDNPYIPPIVITSFKKLNKDVLLEAPLSEITRLTLSYRDYFFSFEFAALDYTAPAKNMYAYKMEGLDDDWILTSANKRFAQYTTLRPGEYVFRVKGSNNDGVWNQSGVSMQITITPPFWDTWWFRSLALLSLALLALSFYRRRLKTVRLQAELRAAHDMQMAIMPQHDPAVGGLDVSGITIPANEVGGDFFDYVWIGSEHQHFGIIVGDISGKAMKAAMAAVMANGVVSAEACNGTTPGEILTRANRILYPKTDRHMFSALCLASINTATKELRIANGGLVKPLLKSQRQFHSIEASRAPHPLGMLSDHVYQDKDVPLKAGDVLILQTDGVPETQDHARQFYGDDRLEQLLGTLDTDSLSARHIRDAIVRDVRDFRGSAPQYDDMTVVVVKVL